MPADRGGSGKAEQQQQGGASTSGRPASQPAAGLPRVPSKHSLLPTREQLIWSKAEASLWLGASAFLIWYGNGTTGTLDIVLHDQRVKRSPSSIARSQTDALTIIESGLLTPICAARRPWFYVGLGFLGVDFLTFLYLSVWCALGYFALSVERRGVPGMLSARPAGRVKRVKNRSKDAAKSAPSIVTTETLSTTAAGILCAAALRAVRGAAPAGLAANVS